MWAGRVLHAALSRAPRESRAQSALAQLRGILEEELESIRGAGTWKSERVITSRQGPHIHVDGAPGGIINFCANNYLGLSSHPEVIQAGLRTLKEFGAGLSSVRFICGTQSIHKDLEAKIARFHQREDAILYPSCFDANTGLFEALLTSEDAVLSDELNHASIIDGIRLCKAHKYRYRHLDMADLEAKLQEAQKHRLRLVATDGAFSMDGDIAPLQEICRLASQYGALVFVDESHATGFLGATGRGTDELLGVMDQVTIINSTLGKALGGASGGYTTGPGALVSLLRQRARPYLFSNSLPPAAVGCASKALDLLMESNAIVQSMAAKTLRFRSQMEAAGFTISGANHPICPVMLGDARLALNIADDMLKRGIFVIGFSYPVVPKGKARIRVQISAVHSEEDIDRCVEAFVEAAIYTLDDWLFGALVCKAVHLLIYLTMYASSFTLAAVSVDRYLAVRHPLRSRALRTPRNARAAVGLVWLLAALFSAPYLSYYGTVRYGALELCVPAWEDARRRALDVATFAAGYLLPVAVVSLAYGRTLRFLWAAVGPAGAAAAEARRRATGRAGRVMLAVAALYALCWGPHHALILCFWYGRFAFSPATYACRLASHCLAYANSCLNPLVYALASRHFRARLRRLWPCGRHRPRARCPPGGARRALRRVRPGPGDAAGCSGNARPRGRLPAGGDWGGERGPEPAGGGEACRALPVRVPE